MALPRIHSFPLSLASIVLATTSGALWCAAQEPNPEPQWILKVDSICGGVACETWEIICPGARVPCTQLYDGAICSSPVFEETTGSPGCQFDPDSECWTFDREVQCARIKRCKCRDVDGTLRCRPTNEILDNKWAATCYRE